MKNLKRFVDFNKKHIVSSRDIDKVLEDNSLLDEYEKWISNRRSKKSENSVKTINTENYNDNDADTENENDTENLDSDFWDFVEDANWMSDYDYNRISEWLYTTYNPTLRRRFHDIFYRYMQELDQRFGDVITNISEDGWFDLRSHVIGRGKRYFENINIERLQNIANTLSYPESFGYVFNDI